MIVSASRRSDIPAFFFPDFLESMKRGFVEVKNPFNAHQVRKVSLKPEDVDAVVFWTKNPLPMEKRFAEFEAFGIPGLVLLTVTPYGPNLEPGIPPKDEIIGSFIRLAGRIGPERVSWRYDPIVISSEMDRDWHRAGFEALAKRLEGSTVRCIASFVSPYTSIRKNLDRIGWRAPVREEKLRLLDDLAAEAESRGMRFQTCADEPPGPAESATGTPEIRDFRGACLEAGILSRLAGKELSLPRDPYQRVNCLCAKSVDIGTYGTCRAGCAYCYAGGSRKKRIDSVPGDFNGKYIDKS